MTYEQEIVKTMSIILEELASAVEKMRWCILDLTHEIGELKE